MLSGDWNLNLEQIIKSVLVSEQSVYMPMKPVSRHTSFRTGRLTELPIRPAVEEDPAEVLCICRKSRVLWRIPENGNDFLVGDKSCEGVVISTRQLSGLGINGNLLRAGTGQLLGRTTHLALGHSLTGMGFITGVPGSAGGALVVNVRVYGSGMKNILKSARMMIDKSRIPNLPAGDLELGYRTNYIPSHGYIVLEAAYELRPEDRGAIEEWMRELTVRRRERQPLEYPSAGSIFK